MSTTPYRFAPDRARAARRSRTGLTAVEMVIGLTVASLVLMNVTSILRSSTDVYKSGTLANVLEEQAELAMDKRFNQHGVDHRHRG